VVRFSITGQEIHNRGQRLCFPRYRGRYSWRQDDLEIYFFVKEKKEVEFNKRKNNKPQVIAIFLPSEVGIGVNHS
jgi:hypothetical protein